ncbi:hypothetical protein SRA_05491 [Streptococcus ratti FA-1 = DSM 20564]|uniref:Uncharacterized protein n=1 Tax=Streptococcus ratti FA-1 = DSM 20564 TaxID=699248 RepID=A0ABN0GU38_STRRT|nr:hypothetical protein SRA_05491 [Streptococcus ratti FA-1 = DSM 20564]
MEKTKSVFSFFDIKSDENFSFKVLEITKAKGLMLDIFDKFVGFL